MRPSNFLIFLALQMAATSTTYTRAANIMHSSTKMGAKSVFFRSPVVFNSLENLEGEGIVRAKMCKGKTVSLAGIFKGVWYSNQLKFLEQV